MMIQRNDLIPVIETLYKKYDGIIETEFNLFQIDVPHNLLDDTFSDWKGVYRPYYKDLYIHKGTINPGADAILNHEGGAAKTKNGFYAGLWVIDIHAADNLNFAHEAFCMRPQMGTKNVTIYRLDRKGSITSNIQSGNDYCINRHRASVQSVIPKIGPYGAACSVSDDHLDHEQELSWAKATSMYTGNKLHTWNMLQVSAIEVAGL